MSLTLEAEQRLRAVSLITLFTTHEADWRSAAKRTYDFVKESFPEGATIRRDDVAQSLAPILEVDEVLRQKLALDKLKQRFWITDFTDLIIDRVWDQIT